MTGYAYATPYEPVHHFAFVQGEIGDGRNIPARLHRVDLIADVITGSAQIPKTLACFRKEGRGVLVLLRDGTAGVPVLSDVKESASEAMRTKEWRGNRRRRANPARPRHLIDPATHLVAAELRWPVGLRDRDRGL